MGSYFGLPFMDHLEGNKFESFCRNRVFECLIEISNFECVLIANVALGSNTSDIVSFNY